MPRTTWPFAILAILLIALAAPRPAAQQDDAAEPEFIEQRYDVAGLIGKTEYTDALWPEIIPYGYGKDFPEYSWPPSHPDPAYVFETTEELTEVVYFLDTDDDLESITFVEFPETRMIVRATARMHDRIAKAIELLEAYANTRIRVELRRLDSLPDNLVLEYGRESGALVGIRNVAHGGHAMFSDITSRTVTWSSYEYGRGIEPQADYMHWGDQWGVSPMLLPDGRIRLQAWHSHVEDKGIRELETPMGLIQLPAVSMHATPGAATIENGGGLVLDAPNGPWLVTAHTEGRIPNVIMEDGDFAIWNPAGALPAGWFLSPWYLKAPPELGQVKWRTVHLPQEAAVDFPLQYPQAASMVAGEYMVDALRDFVEYSAPLSVLEFYPMVGTARRDLWGDEKPAEMEAGLEYVMKQLERVTMGPEHHALRVAVLRVPREADLPDSVLQGRGGDIDALRLIDGAEVMLDRRLNLADGQRADVMDVELQNFLQQVTTDEYSGSADVATWGHGVQVRLSLRTDGKLAAWAAWRHSANLRRIELDGTNEGIEIEHPEASDVTFRVIGPERQLCMVQPAGKDHLAIFVVAREGDE